MKKEEESVPPPAVDPRLCCAAQICCDNPDDALKALTEFLQDTITTDNPNATHRDMLLLAAANILDNFDLVPKGAATQLYKSLRPWFEQAERKKEREKV